MTSQQEEELREVLKNLVPMIQKLRDRNITEENTKSSLIDPVLVALEWNVGDPDEVDHERKDNNDCNPVDYALMVREEAKILVEAKRLGVNLKTGYAELFGNAAVSGIRWCVLTDGDKYRVYNADGHGDAEERRFFEVCISDGKDDAVKYLSLLAQSNMAGNPPSIDIEWEKYSVDKRVKTALQAMLNPVDPVDRVHEGLIRLIRQKHPELKLDVVAASLMRLEVRDRGELSFSQPSVNAVPAVRVEPQVKHKIGNAAEIFRSIIGTSETTFMEADLIEKLMNLSGCTRVTARSYIDYAKLAKKGPMGGKGPRANPFPFRLEESKDERGNKILRKVE